MSFLFGRRPRASTVDLPKQAKEQILKLDSPGAAGIAKVRKCFHKLSGVEWGKF